MKREDIDNKYKWNLKDLFESENDFEKLYKRTEDGCDFSAYKGKLNDRESVLELFKKQDVISLNIERLYTYAMLNHDCDTRDSFYDGLCQRVMMLMVKAESQTSFVLPELVSLDEKIIKEYIADKDFAPYSYSLKNVLKNKKHVLTEEGEKIMALAGDTLSQFHDIFGKIDNADLPLKPITHKGKKYPLTHGMYSVLMQDSDRDLRKKAFKAYYNAYIGLNNTITSTYYGNVKKNVFITKARGYKSCLIRALENEDVDGKVYKNLIKYVHNGLPLMHKYVFYKKQALNLEKMHMYDMYVPTVTEGDMQLSYEDAYELVKKALKPLGDEYIDLLCRAYDEKWIDVMENEGKRSGAYSTAVYGVHPYVLLNYQKTTHNVFTIAHELGHSIHSYYSNREQPYAKSDYKIFVAEVASTVNEMLLLRYVVANTQDKMIKKYLLTYLLEMIRTTLYRQTQFAEFEEIAHSTVEKGQPLTKDFLNKTYLKLNKKYYGKGVTSDKEIAYEWSRIPHFYSAFYVYKYATGIISAIDISDRILKEGQSAVDKYKKFLSSGSSDSPVELLKIAGVDLMTEAPFENAFKVFGETLEQLTNI